MLLAILLLAAPAMCLVKQYHGVEIQEGTFWYEQLSMYRAGDAPVVAPPGTSYISVNLSFATSGEPEATAGHVEVIVTHAEYLTYVGVESNVGVRLCCTEEMVRIGGCAASEVGFVMRNGPEGKHLSHTVVEVDRALDAPRAFHAERIPVKRTGLHYVLVVNCNYSHAGTVHMWGDSSFANPFGFLEAGQLPTIFAFAVVGGWSLLVLVAWLMLLHYNHNYVILLHHGVSLMLLFAALEGLFGNVSSNLLNNQGYPCLSCTVMQVLAGSLKGTMVRLFLLLLSFGYSIDTMEIYSRRQLMGIVALTVGYFISSGGQRLLVELEFLFGGSPSLAFNLDLMLNLLNPAIYVWIFFEFSRSLGRMRMEGEVHKMSYMLKTFYLLVSLAIVGLLLMVMEMVVKFRNDAATNWSFMWSFDAAWLMVYLAVICSIALIWKPSESTAAASYSTQVQGFDWDRAPRNVLREQDEQRFEDDDDE